MEQYALLCVIILLLIFMLIERIITHRKSTQPSPEPEWPRQEPTGDHLPPPPDLRPKTWLSDSPASILDGAIHDDFVRLLDRFISIVLKENDVSASVLMQLTGYHQAAKFIDHMEVMGLIGPSRLPLSREIFLTDDQYQNILRKRLFRYRTELDVADVEFVETLLDRLKRDILLIRSGALTADSLSDDLLADVDLMDGPAFEKWCTELLTKLGYRIESPKNRGHGAHLLAEKEDVLYALQCRCCAEALDDTPIQEVLAGQRYYHRHVGIVMTNRTFTPGACAQAKELNILLWNRDKLKLLIEKESLLPF